MTSRQVSWESAACLGRYPIVVSRASRLIPRSPLPFGDLASEAILPSALSHQGHVDAVAGHRPTRVCALAGFLGRRISLAHTWRRQLSRSTRNAARASHLVCVHVELRKSAVWIAHLAPAYVKLVFDVFRQHIRSRRGAKQGDELILRHRCGQLSGEKSACKREPTGAVVRKQCHQSESPRAGGTPT